jgi:hypothetical protein
MEDYDEVGFDLDTRFLIRALIAMGTGQSRFRYLTEFWKKQPAEINAVWSRTKKAVDSGLAGLHRRRPARHPELRRGD